MVSLPRSFNVVISSTTLDEILLGAPVLSMLSYRIHPEQWFAAGGGGDINNVVSFVAGNGHFGIGGDGDVVFALTSVNSSVPFSVAAMVMVSSPRYP